MKLNEKLLSTLPIKLARYIILDTETTGLLNEDHIIELAAVEVKNGKLTGIQFSGFFKARLKIKDRAFQIHHMDNNFFQKNCEYYIEDGKTLLMNFLDFLKDSLIFAHNADFDYKMLNRELEHYNLGSIKIERYRCTMRIFGNLMK